MEIPQGFYVSLRPRSGLALKNGITLLNSPATIDSDYRGEIRVIMINLGEEDFIISHGDRICQMLLEKSQEFEWQEVTSVSDLDPSYRGEGGFGSTGTSGIQFA
jgi:dUTP pyrophosphatase